MNNLKFKLEYCDMLLKDAEKELSFLTKHDHSYQNAIGSECLWCSPVSENGVLSYFTCKRVTELQSFTQNLASQIVQYNMMKKNHKPF